MVYQREQNPSLFDGKTILVTGGSSGIGLAAALLFARLGGNVLITGRHAEALAETTQSHQRIVSVVADVSNEENATTVVKHALDLWGRLDVLVNNAAMFISASLEAITPDQAIATFQTNVLGPTWLSKAALEALTNTSGSIINISSTFGHRPAAQIGHYAASKAALEHLTRCWALELAPRKVRVNAIAPGPTETPVLQRAGLSMQDIETIKQTERASIPLGRRGEPEEVAHWIISLANPTVTWVTGQVITIDGGMELI